MISIPKEIQDKIIIYYLEMRQSEFRDELFSSSRNFSNILPTLDYYRFPVLYLHQCIQTLDTNPSVFKHLFIHSTRYLLENKNNLEKYTFKAYRIKLFLKIRDRNPFGDTELRDVYYWKLN